MTKQFRPMLAVEADVNSIRFPVFVSPKLDGIRLVWKDHNLRTRSLKKLPNIYLREKLAEILHYTPDLDGEVIVGEPTGEGVFRRTESAVMRKEGAPDYTYHVFDTINKHGFVHRMYEYKALVKLIDRQRVKIVPQSHCLDRHELDTVERDYLALGYEGVMIRSVDGPYKCGRSTLKEGYLLKLKRFKDAEAMIIGYYPKMHNGNEATEDERGYTKRSSHKANKVEMGTLGKLLVVSDDFKEPFCIGTGFDDGMRYHIWHSQEECLGQLVKFKYQDYGIKDKPRSPVFLGFRDERDL